MSDDTEQQEEQTQDERIASFRSDYRTSRYPTLNPIEGTAE